MIPPRASSASSSTGSRAWVVEIVGPAGAGKTTLYRALARTSPKIQPEPLPPVWDAAYLPFFGKHILGLVPTLWKLRGTGDRRLTRRELAWMAMLAGWPNLLRRKAHGPSLALLMDQGPVFLMTILQEFGPHSLSSPQAQPYWQNVTQRWKQTLDMIIWLDAEDETLIRRIRMRPDEHIVKEKTDQEICSFLAVYRRAYERLIQAVAAGGCPAGVIKLDTGRVSVEESVGRVLQSFASGLDAA